MVLYPLVPYLKLAAFGPIVEHLSSNVHGLAERLTLTKVTALDFKSLKPTLRR